MIQKIDETALKAFAKQSGMSIATVRKKWKSIPGITRKNKAYIVAQGTRYPYSMRGKNKLNAEKQRFYLLDAIFHNKYIDHVILRCEEVDFKDYLKDLMAQGLIRKRQCQNTKGANGYAATPKADKVFQEKRTQQYCEYAKVFGSFTGALINEAFGQ